MKKRGPESGIPILASKISESRRELFWSMVQKDGPDECWLWTGRRVQVKQNRDGRKFLVSNGYGIFTVHAIKKGPIHAHRISYALHNGYVPRGRVVMHSCDNKQCVNPKHLSTGTQHQNMLDAHSKGIYGGPKGPISFVYCLNGHLRRGEKCVECERIRNNAEAERHAKRIRLLLDRAKCLPDTLDGLAEMVGRKRAEVFAEYCGLYGMTQRTLQYIGDRRGISRERVRQITNRVAELVGAAGVLEIRKMAIDDVQTLEPELQSA